MADFRIPVSVCSEDGTEYLGKAAVSFHNDGDGDELIMRDATFDAHDITEATIETLRDDIRHYKRVVIDARAEAIEARRNATTEPEPTNAELLDATIRDIWENSADVGAHGIRALAEHLDQAGVKANDVDS